MSIQRMILHVNGTDREILCDPEKDSLADVVRRLGLTGTKVGCGNGQCGACSLLLDGQVTRSCVKKMKHVRPHAKVETIEGLGSEERPHPLQQAFVTYAGVQCGFCSPGFSYTIPIRRGRRSATGSPGTATSAAVRGTSPLCTP